MGRVVILDGYIDEPSCLGVPPYLSPHARYIYGALIYGGIKEERIDYVTIDQVREDPTWYERQGKAWIIVLGGTTVPGKYLGGNPLTLKEMRCLPLRLVKNELWLVGPIVEAGLTIEGYDHFAPGSGAFDIYSSLQGPNPFSLELLKEFALLGARLLSRHPNYPYLMIEIETYRGCQRESQCAFCSERFKKLKYIRPVDDVLAEVGVLAKEGAKYFRLGCQPDILSYQDAEGLKRLYAGFWERCPSLKVLHLDNVNSLNLVQDLEKGKELLKIICQYNTPGDIASLGLESADEKVILANNIGTSPQEQFRAIQLINEIGGQRKDGLPLLLPGLNLLHGLRGESSLTYKKNLAFLKEIIKQDLLVRRINIRQVISFGGYEAKAVRLGAFNEYKAQINQEINRPMLEKLFPLGLLLREVIMEKYQGNLTFGRQMGTYPIRIGLVGQFPLKEARDVKVVGHGYRSLTALPYPLNINKLNHKQLEALPKVGEKRAASLILKRPFSGPQDLLTRVEKDLALELVNWFDEY